jgi:hypothetical protein
MNKAGIVELTLIPVLGTGLWWIAAKLPDHIELGRLLLGASALLLFQSLIRDLWLLANAPRKAQQASPPRVARCMCVESMVGITGIVIGLTLFGWSIGKPVPMGRWSWSIVAMLVMAAGFLMKDYVLETKPWRLRRDTNHLNIIVKWKR